MAKIVYERKVETTTKKVGEVNPALASLYDIIADEVMGAFGEKVLKVKQGSIKKEDKEGKVRTFKTGCKGLLFDYNGETVALELTFKDPETFNIEDCIVEATYEAE